jgi:serine protease Do
MARRYLLFFIVLLLVFPVSVFSQQGASASGLRDYVGLINQTYHPGVVAWYEKQRVEYEKLGETEIVRKIDILLSGGFGSGFIYSDARGTQYVITNHHVITDAYTISISFEQQDGTKKKFDLNLIASDEDIDLAILAFSNGEKPVSRGLVFLNRAVQEGEDVFSAGFPALGITPVWQFGRGMISNAFARFPKSLTDETLMGPFIQHTAQVDSGNSGGPLLIAQTGAPSGYAVAGINTLSALWRQAANYAIPVNTVQTFIESALNPKPDTFRSVLNTRLEKFIEGLGVNRAVYPHISEYLSTACVGENAEYALTQMSEKGDTAARRTLRERINSNPASAMSIAVAWTIENSIRPKGGGALRASIKEVTGEGDEYTVVFTINSTDVSSVWVREYGNWRIRSFGTVATGDASLIEKRKAARAASEKLRINSDFYVEAGYANLFEKAPAALYLSVGAPAFCLNIYIVDANFMAFSLLFGHQWGISAGPVGFMPFFRAGVGLQFDQDYKDFQDMKKEKDPYGQDLFPPAFFIGGHLGMKITTSAVPGLFFAGTFQLNLLNFHTFANDYKNPMKMALCITVGYAF